MKPWKTLQRTLVFDHSRFLKVEDHTIELPDGRLLTGWPWVESPDYIIVVFQTEAGQFGVFRQTKYGVTGDTLATVGGYIEPGEDPLAAAQRELLEETGYAAEDWVDLGKYRVDGNHGNGNAFLFLARRARGVTPIQAGDLEEQHLLLLSRAELQAALLAGEFRVLAWATGVALALQYLDGCA